MFRRFTGVKVYGERERKPRQHGVSKRRTWRKLHLGIDEASGEILAAVVTTNDFKDGQVLADILEQIEDEKYTYHFVDLNYADSVFDLQQFSELYINSSDGYVKPPKMPGELRSHLLVRVPSVIAVLNDL